ncbi:hypothetical protein P152DRAFT_461071 [Eremomyces bilateralis CBS 781.70]|uniref:Alpha/beta hydrolase fold-3 domain-containing protein n=1 Tax=Eremomyces bilateralis CBS 781.70 TaxID=1392243 RepID=A0A6G1FW34_9PEZI|nr:uncharacterized protein P152DRAFT_461071 [Eremomyces bilateralis CBS 781.70]KAF1809994.1 hypothetical protein P152DRAFT_461071 [Eremomyces bilateralis CBS 781.70]
MASQAGQIRQPLQPSIRPILDPEYVTLHDSLVQYVEPLESKPWDPENRNKPSALAHAQPKLVDVGQCFDKVLGNVQLRVFVPEGEAPAKGWPCMVWYHGGGWVNGGLGSDNGFLSHVCRYTRCMAISVNYRHAPEDVYPAALEDSFWGFQWIRNNAATLSIDISRLVLGGCSAGGNLAAVMSLKAGLAKLSPAPVFQLLICPVIDCTATVNTAWATTQHSPFLTPGRMTWYQDRYLPNPSDRANWDVSPCFAPPETLALSPKTFVAIAECDLLAPEGLRYAELLRKAGVEVETKTYKGATHSILVLAGIHQIGQQLVHDACAVIARELGTEYDPSTSPILSQSG